MKKELQEYICDQISEKLNIHFQDTKFSPIHGGDINETGVLYNGSEQFFIKINQGKPDDFFEKEMNGLQTLQKAKHSLKIPTPYLYGKWDNQLFIVMEFLEPDNMRGNFAEKLGHGLAELHQNTWTSFGLHENNYLGSQPQENIPNVNWAHFYAEKCLIPMSKRAFNNGYFDKNDLEKMEHLCKDLGNIFPTEAPSLLHGDLWNGNYGCAVSNTPSIFDPAVYYGNREMDIAMTL